MRKRRWQKKEVEKQFTTTGDKYHVELSLRYFHSIAEMLEGYDMKLSPIQEENLNAFLEFVYHMMVCGIQHIHFNDIHFYNTMWEVSKGRKRVRYNTRKKRSHLLKYDWYEMPRNLDEYQLQEVVFKSDLPMMTELYPIWSQDLPFVWKGKEIHKVTDIEDVSAVSYHKREGLYIIQFYKNRKDQLRAMPRIAITFLEYLGSMLHSYEKGMIHAAALRYARAYWKTTPKPAPPVKRKKEWDWDLLDEQIKEYRNNEKQSEASETNDTPPEA